MADMEKQTDNQHFMNPLEAILRNEIEKLGAMPFARYMEQCLFHSEYGYYNTYDPLQDFATAPEISQLFGEMIAVWCVDVWMKLGSPNPFILLECGPGRGTLMSDVLRTVKMAPGFTEAARIYLFEKSPLLKNKQRALLQDYTVTWVDELAEIPHAPIIMFCNEFFDAFPVQPFVKTPAGWGERAVSLEHGECVYSVLSPSQQYQSYFRDSVFTNAPIGAIAEINTTANSWVDRFAQRLFQHGGGALIIDYGYAGPELANTVQAIHNRKMAPVLKHAGQADITSHLDFTPLRQMAQMNLISCSPLQLMGDFLINCGIKLRAQRLKTNATEHQRDAIDQGFKRLTASEQMGHLFKVICLYHNTLAPPIGCEA